MADNNYEWQTKNSKNNNRNRSNNFGPYFIEARERINSSNPNDFLENGVKKNEVIKKKEDIRVWLDMNECSFDDMEKKLHDRLKQIKETAYNKIEVLWDCLYFTMKEMPKSKKLQEDFENIFYEVSEINYRDDHTSITELSKRMKCHIIFFHITKCMKRINYGLNESTCIKLLYVGGDYFIPLKKESCEIPYTLSVADKKILEGLIIPKEVTKSNNKEVNSQEFLLKKLSNMLRGLERVQDPYVPSTNTKKLRYYDVYPQERLDKDKSLRLCILNLQTAHNGIATLIYKTPADKMNEISLLNRKNCGYNAFQGDKVYVKINDQATFTGQVVGVASSNYKPINSLYICKICKHQGSLMKPLDLSFPKIHVDNEPGRRKYEAELKQKGSSSVQRAQLSDDMKSRESSSFADNVYVSIYQMKVEKDAAKPTFFNPIVEKVDPEMSEHLFLVCYEYWDISSMYPNGKVVGIFSTFDSFKDSLHLILPICKVEPQIVVDDRYKKEINNIKKKVMEKKGVIYDVVPKGAMIFTIDGEDTQDMDDALSYHVKDDMTIVGVHITDVTKYISPQHDIYKHAKRRFSTVYPPKNLNHEPFYLYSKELSSNLLSLRPNEPRAVVSVMFSFKEVKDKPPILTTVTFHETFIISKYKLNYKEVEQWLTASCKPSNVEEDLFIALKGCYEIAKQIRRVRLPDSYFVLNSDNSKYPFEYDECFNSKFLIEEFMILANEYVGKRIYGRYPNMSLLRVQDPVTDYDEWIEKLFTNINMNFTSSLNQCCRLLKTNRVAENRIGLTVSRKFYDDFISNVNINVSCVRNMIRSDQCFNDFYVYLVEWYRMSHPARYDCSIPDSVSNAHFSLDKKLYTHFTSPARRFSDVIVHRLLKSTLDGAPAIDSIDEQDILEVCENGNRKRKMIKLFEKLCCPYGLFEETQSHCSYILYCAVSNITNDEIQLLHPSLEKCNSTKNIRFSYLSLDQPPVQLKLNENSGACSLKWKKIIFSYDPQLNPSSSNRFVIDHRLNDAVLPDSAYKLFREIRRSYSSSEDLFSKLTELGKKFMTFECHDRITSDSNSLADPIIDISMNLYIKNTVKVQFCSHKVNGLQKVAPELFVVSPTLQLCLFHNEDPIQCFVPGGKLELSHSDLIQKFDSIDQYVKYFKPLIHVESLMEILGEKSEFTLIELPIHWIPATSPITKKNQIYGVLKIRDKFCTSKNIIFSDEREKIIDRYEYIVSEGIKSISGDLLCLRSKPDTWKKYWIGHGEVLNVCRLKEEDDTYKVVFFMLTHYNNDIFRKYDKTMTFSVDVYLRSVVSKRQMEALNSVHSNPFMKQVILGNQIPKSLDRDDGDMMDYIMEELKKQRIPYPNDNQRSAITKAMTEKLSLIWGPPGTGKTSIGCILAFAYSMKNAKLDNNGVVLYCGPSNDCVNLVTIEMQRKFIDTCPKMLRIYGEQQELADFPLPGFFSRNNKPLTGELQKYSLHFLIREMNDPLSSSLKNFDIQFANIRNNAHNFDRNEDVRSIIHEMVKSYKSILKEAKLNLLKKESYNMVLCTTSVSATKILDNFTITQVIIDEAGMCKEPETLIPILMASETVENMVLIGDHKQLRPIIHSNVASKRGLQISMFERYQSLRRDLVTMLNFQYRMHPSICEFPSNYFYSSKLITNISQLWSGLGQDDIKKDMIKYKYWNGIDYKCANSYYKDTLKQSNYSAIDNKHWPGIRDHPYRCFRNNFLKFPERLVFIHTIGDETIQSISTAAGNENSRANEVEVEAVGYIYNKLIDRLQPPRLAPNFITVLTQYKLQEDKLNKKCKEILLKRRNRLNPIVKTVIRSQGSENDYIIFSTVRSLRNKEDINENPSPGWERQYLGFITDKNQVNVALTRAKKGLIIIGNKNLLSANKMWKDLIMNLEDRGCVLNSVTDFL